MRENLLLSTLAITLVLSCGEKPKAEAEQKKAMTSSVTYSSNFIPVDSAQRMMGSYLASLPASDTENLHAIEFDAADLRDYLSDSTIKTVRINLAHTLSYINSGNWGVPAGYGVNKLTFIIIGASRSGAIVPAPNDLYLNKGFPCPPYCPPSTL